MLKCAKCSTVLSEGDVFCPECGTKKTNNESVAKPVQNGEAPLENAKEALNCFKCNASIETSDLFCPVCGMKQMDFNMINQPQQREQEQLVADFVASPNANKIDHVTEEYNRRMRKVKIVKATIVALIILVIIALIMWLVPMLIEFIDDTFL